MNTDETRETDETRDDMKYVSRYVSPCHVAVCLTSTGQTFQTVQGNSELMKNSFNLTAMPKTFQDAIELTRSLSIKYLWIDSLRMRDEAKFPKKKSPENHFRAHLG